MDSLKIKLGIIASRANAILMVIVSPVLAAIPTIILEDLIYHKTKVVLHFIILIRRLRLNKAINTAYNKITNHLEYIISGILVLIVITPYTSKYTLIDFKTLYYTFYQKNPPLIPLLNSLWSRMMFCVVSNSLDHKWISIKI